MPPSFVNLLFNHPIFSPPGVKSEGEGVHGIDAVTVTQGEIDFSQRGPTPGEYWGLTEQVMLSQRMTSIWCLHAIP